MNNNYRIYTVAFAFFCIGIMATRLVSHQKQYVVQINATPLPAAQWQEPEASLTTPGSLTNVMVGPKASLWYAVFDYSLKKNISSSYASDAADEAVRTAFAAPPYAERATVWYSVYVKACESSSSSYAADAATKALNASY